MLGGSLTKLLKWGAIAGVALIIGSQLISSVAWVVLAMRGGNYLPLIAIFAISLVLQRSSALVDSKSALMKILVEILAGASMLYLFFVVLVGLLPLGLIMSFSGASFSLLICMVVRDPTSLKDGLVNLMESAEVYRGSGLSMNPDHNLAGRNYVCKQNIEVLGIPSHAFDDVVNVIRDRPMLPVVLVHLEEADFLLVRTNSEIDWTRQIKQVLDDVGISRTSAISPLLKKFVLLYPILDENEGLSTMDYCLAVKESSTKILLESKPPRMMVFPGPQPRIVCRRESIPGIEVLDIPSSQIPSIILAKQPAPIEQILEPTESVLTAH